MQVMWVVGLGLALFLMFVCGAAICTHTNQSPPRLWGQVALVPFSTPQNAVTQAPPAHRSIAMISFLLLAPLTTSPVCCACVYPTAAPGRLPPMHQQQSARFTPGLLLSEQLTGSALCRPWQLGVQPAAVLWCGTHKQCIFDLGAGHCS